MKAAISKVYGGPQVIELKEIKIPEPKDFEIQVRIKFSTVNRTDCGFLRGKPLIARLVSGLLNPKNKVLGSEFAGDVVKVGSLVKDFNIGDRVFGLSQKKFGCHADYLNMNASSSVYKIPNQIDYKTAAASCEGPWLARTYLKKINLDPSFRMLINGGTGSIGSAALQIVKAHGLQCTVVCNSNGLDIVSRLGADEIIDYSKEDFSKRTYQAPFHYIFDAVGKSSFKKCKHLLTENGVYMSTELGERNENPFLALTTKGSKKKVLFPIPMEKKEDIVFIAEWLNKGKYHPLIDKTYPFEQLKEAYTYVESEQKLGNVLIEH